jgi:hypothetical protein
MNCAGVITKLPKLNMSPDNRVILPPSLYKECLKRWGKEYVEKHYIKDQPVK